jgi:dCTP diphosphatase
MSELNQLRDAMRQFANEREWEQFHSPKNLSMALAVEAAELMEHFQWLTEAESLALKPEKKQAVAHEMADVLLYLVRMADRLDVDLFTAGTEKMKLNALKYPVETTRGSFKKPDSR